MSKTNSQVFFPGSGLRRPPSPRPRRKPADRPRVKTRKAKPPLPFSLSNRPKPPGIWKKFWSTVLPPYTGTVGAMSAALLVWTAFSLSVGLIFCALYSSAGSTFSVMSIIYCAAQLTGGLVGFIFGIPRVEQSDAQNLECSDSIRARILANTNLEKVSDWLTTIIIGIGLTQFRSIAEGFNSLTSQISADLHPDINSAGSATGTQGQHSIQEGFSQSGSSAFVGALIIAGLTAGFITGWLFCRLLLIEALRHSEKRDV